MNVVPVFSVDIAAVTGDGFRRAVVDLLRGNRPVAVAKVNAEFLLRSLVDEDFRAYLASTALNIADGVGVLWAARFLTMRTTKVAGLRQLQILAQATWSLLSLVVSPRFCRTPIPERIPGVDALMIMLEAAQEADAGVFFLGATSEINEAARAKIQASMPNLRIAGGSDGYSGEWAAVLTEIERSGAALVVVALGCPKQEFWIRDHLAGFGRVRVAVGEGGSLDFIAGDFRRAPKWMQALGLEWLWRLFMNPNKSGSTSRARRIWDAVPVFIYHTVKWKLGHGGVSVTERVSA